MDQNAALAEQLLPLLGGAENVVAVENCMTRMRVTYRDRSRLDDAAIGATPGVLGVVDDETFQIILGPGKVTKVVTAFRDLLAGTPATVDASPHPPGASNAEELAARGADLKARQKQRNNTPFKNFTRKIANIFVPLIPALIGAGMVAAIRGLLANWVTLGTAPGWVEAVVPALTVIGTAFFAYLAIFAGINAAKEFGGTPALGGAVAAIIVMPQVAEISYTLPWIGEVQLSPGQGGVIGAIFAAALCSWVERLLRGRIPDAVDILVTPTLALLVSGLATIFVFMFAAGQLATAIGNGSTWLLENSGLLAGFLLGGLFLPLVMLGLHQALIPIHATLIEQLGFTPLLTILAMAGAGQVGAAIAIYLKLNKNRSMRDTIKGALPVGILGVGEPLIYAVSLPLGRPFITACLGGAVGGAVAGAFNQFVGAWGSTAIGPSGWALLPLLESDSGQGFAMLAYVTGLAAGYVAGFFLTYWWGFSRQLLAEHNVDDDAFAGAPTASGPGQPETAAETDAAGPIGVISPAEGEIGTLDDVPDQVFSSRMMGDGFCVHPRTGRFHAPVSGEIATLFPTGHAFAIKTDEGLEVLVHIGLETVGLKGEGFTAHRAVGDRVTQGDLVVEADLDLLRTRVPSLVTPVVVLNGNAFEIVRREEGASEGPILTVAAKATTA